MKGDRSFRPEFARPLALLRRIGDATAGKRAPFALTALAASVAALAALGLLSLGSPARDVETDAKPAAFLDPSITFRAASSAGNSNATTLTISRPAGVVQNDFLIAQITVRGGIGTTITAPAGWTLLRRENNGATLGQAIYHKVATASEPASYTWMFNGNRTASGGIIAYSGVDTANPIDASGGQTGSGSMVTAPSIITTTSDTMLVGFFGIAHSATFTPPMGMTERYDVASTGAPMPDRTSSAGADEPRPMAGPTGTRTATATQSAAWVGQSVALRPTAVARTTSTTVECDPEEFQAGGSTECTATVTDTGPGAGSPPMGTVSWESDQTGAFAPNPCVLVSTGAESSACSVTYTSTVVGEHELTATYSGSLAHASSSGTATVTVTLRATTTTVECDPEEFQAGGSTECTATVTDTGPGAGSPPMGTVSWESDQTGAFAPNPCVLVSTGAESSACSVTYTSTVVGEHELTATYSGSLAHASSSGTATVTVTPGPPATVTVDPPTDVNEIDEEHCVTATVTDAFDNPTPGVTVFFTVTGSNRASGTRTTGADGTTGKFCYTGRLFGEDLITAVADANDNGKPDQGEPTGTATKTWLLPGPPLPCDVIVTEGGWIIADNGDRASFGGNAHAETGGEVTGEQNYQDHGPVQPMQVKSTEVLTVLCSQDGKRASIFGFATIDGSGQHAYRIDVGDLGEPGVGSDTYGILLSTGYESGEQVLKGGNVQIHLK
jgi:Bacterial Ig-like domain (group 1)/Bacterial Ig-like domain (group 3)